MKNIIITGASGGIGSAIAKKLESADVRLILLYNKHKRSILSLVKSLNCQVECYACDLSVSKQIEDMFKDVLKKYKHIDGLVNCAGVSSFKQIQDVKEEDFDFVFNNNLKSVVMLTSLVAKNMIENKKGKIVNISSMWGVVGASMESLYSASKAAINNLTLSLAKELGPSGIQVNCVCPGLVDTKMNANLTDETVSDLISNTPLNRIGKPEDVANLVEFLMSDKADFITGQIITVDGGLSL